MRLSKFSPFLLALLKYSKTKQQRADVCSLGMNKEITSKGFCLLFDYLRDSISTVQTLCLRYAKMNAVAMHSLGLYIQANQSIVNIDLSNSSVNDVLIEVLTPYLEGNTTFQSISFSNCLDISVKSLPMFKRMIELSHIGDIDINYTIIPKRNALVLSLFQNVFKHGLSSVNMQGKEIVDDDIYQFCDFMKQYGADKLKRVK